ncbi:helix-turn-helix domain-containing protein [Cronobacter malonaticus]|uniref:helix-turn-helix domain-containing protein n=1 Tax=Cronobacter malonaticus TaxID=413503 RepID=UPI002937488C|nr:helix-turn-helix domain-containing protein [Cronobacter malonaticus]
MKPSLLNLLLRGGMSYRDISEELGIKKHRVQWFVLELERRGWIEVKRKIICLFDGTTSNAINQYRRGKL